MAGEGDKTEQPTARRRQEARSRGQIARSQDLTAAVLLLAALLILDAFGSRMLERLYAMMHFLLGGGAAVLRPGPMVDLAILTVSEMGGLLLPLLAVFWLTALVVVFAQTGFLVSWEAARPKFSHINPVSGLRKFFSGRAAGLLVINLAKLGIVTAVLYYTLRDRLDVIIHFSSLPFSEMAAVAIDLFFTVGLRVALILVLLGIIDWFYQRYRHERSLRMTKEEVKEELRRMDGDPLMKRRRREVQMKLAVQRLRRDVPKADVVVTNPTHLAVALRYDEATMRAPRVLAKGEGFMAERIRDIAREAGVPVIERKPLAQALYKMVEVGQEIPPELYKAVAEVLAFVYELAGKRRRRAV